MMRVYLAGGMKTPWRETLKTAVESALIDPDTLLTGPGHLVTWVDPADHDLEDPAHFVPADLALVGSCDLLVVVIENEDFSPIGAAVEMGHARADRTPIVYYQEPGRPEGSLRFMKHTADIVVDSPEMLVRAVAGLARAGL